MLDAFKSFLARTIGHYGAVFVCAMLPLIELRGSVILGAALSMPWWSNLLISIVGNMLPIPFILLFMRWFLEKMKSIRFLSGIANWLERKAEKNKGKVEKYGFWGLCLLVAIPLPGTGAWTGAFIAAILRLRLVKATLALLAGVLASGMIMGLISHGVFSFLGI